MPERGAGDDPLLARLAAIERLLPTLDLAQRDSYVASAGWHVDSRVIDLPSEPPGLPAPDLSFALACAILTEYSFPPPRLIRGRFTQQSVS